MGYLEEMFDPDFLFDNNRRQRRDLKGLQAGMEDDAQEVANLRRTVARLAARLDRQELLNRTLVTLFQVKGLATADEIEVLVQQVDLLDGVEDGKVGDPRADAPTCPSCGHYVNPKRRECVYCGEVIQRADAAEGTPYRGGAPAGEAAPERTASCSACGDVVPQRETYFTDEGNLVCTSCNAGA